MFKQISSFFWRSYRGWLYGLLSLVTAVIVSIGIPQPSYGISWMELIFRGVQIIQLSSLSDSQEVKLGKQINQQLLQGGQITIYDNAQINRYVNKIGQRLAKTSDRRNIPYTFQVVKDKSINAFATMGGFVYINTGLMRIADNEAELASVVGHEIGHIVGRHAVKQMRDRALAQGALSAAGLDQSTAVQMGVELALNRPHSRKAEFQADQLGLGNLQRAGYAPSGMVSFMKKLQKQGGSIPAFLSTHPATSNRVVALQQAINPEIANLGDGLNNQAYKSKIRSLR
ncbi:MAG: M48 family metalloprotease [Moorea sp. SIO2B7]|nr:M48 family metalloprotease [Moorena sp. SIO2B7]